MLSSLQAHSEGIHLSLMVSLHKGPVMHSFNACCSPEQAAENKLVVVDLGFHDVLMW